MVAPLFRDSISVIYYTSNAQRMHPHTGHLKQVIGEYWGGLDGEIYQSAYAHLQLLVLKRSAISRDYSILSNRYDRHSSWSYTNDATSSLQLSINL